jgi:hypothetical protein
VDAPPSPPARRLRPPSWFDPRLILGVLLVVGSVAAGSAIISAADRSVQVWALTRDTAVGTVLSAEDVRPARVRLFDSAPGYVGTARSPAGQAVTRTLSAGELLPAAALATGLPGLVVNLPVRRENAPSVARGQAVDVWAGTKDCGPRRVLASVAVQDVRTDDAGALTTGTGLVQIVLRVGRADADRLLAVLGADSTIRLVVVDGAPVAGPPAAPCGRDGGARP